MCDWASKPKDLLLYVYNGVHLGLEGVLISQVRLLWLRLMGWRHICFCPVRPSVRLSVRLSVCPYATFFSAAITKKPIAGLSWNWGNIFSTQKWRAELFFQHRGIQDGRLSTTYVWNLYMSVSLYWVLTFELCMCHFRSCLIISHVARNHRNCWKWRRGCKIFPPLKAYHLWYSMAHILYVWCLHW